MSEELLERILRELSQEGEIESTGSPFTLDPRAAREKMRLLSVARPGGFVLGLVAAGVASGAGRISLKLSNSVLRMSAESTSLEPATLRSLFSHLFSVHFETRALRELALAVYQAIDSGARRVTVESAAWDGGVRLVNTPTSQQVVELPPGERTLEVVVEGTGPGLEELISSRGAYCPIPLLWNGRRIDQTVELGACAALGRLEGPVPLAVGARASLVLEEPHSTLSGSLALGGGWTTPHVVLVTDGVSHQVERPELGLADLKAIVHSDRLLWNLSRTGLVEQEDYHACLECLRNLVQRVRSAYLEQFDRLDPPPRPAAAFRLLHSHGLELRARGELEAAVRVYERLLCGCGWIDQHLCRRVLATLDYARERQQAAADRLRPLLGHPANPEIAECLAMVEAAEEDWTSAENDLLGAEQQLVRLYDHKDRSQVVPCLCSQASLCLWRHRYPQAERLAKRALARTVEVHGDSHPALGPALETLGEVYLCQNRLDEALALADQALGLVPDRASTLLLRAAILVEQGRQAESLEAAEGAIRLRSPVHPEGSGGLLVQALGHLRARRPAEAVPLAKGARGIRQTVFGPGHAATVEASTLLAMAQHAAGELEQASESLAPVLESGRACSGLALDLACRLELARERPGQAAELGERALESLRTRSRQHLLTLSYRWWDPQSGPEIPPPLRLPARLLGRESEEWARAAAHLARVYRALGREREADHLLALCRSVRATRVKARLAMETGTWRLVKVHYRLVHFEVTIQAPGRTLRSITMHSARGRTASSEADPDSEAVLMAMSSDRKILNRSGLGELDESPRRYLLFAHDEGSSRVAAIPYVLSLQFDEGPPRHAAVIL
ncbi:MAG: tetratricopeptide repeat protein [Armatimonadetes bacterium]|nr:tetratricopeptide repeat protein [Armatimonadota bacterium]